MIKGLAAQGYGRAVMMGGQILAVPILVTRWGASGYGEWITLTALASYITYANVGVPGAVRADLALAYAEGGHEHMRRSFQTCLILMIGLGAACASAFVALMHQIPLGWLVRDTALNARDAVFIATALAIQVALAMVVGVFQATLSAIGKYGKAGFYESNRQAAEFAGLLILVGVLRKGPTVACLVYPALMAVHLGVLIGRVEREAPWVLAQPWQFDGIALRRLLRPMMGVLATTLGYYSMTLQAPRVILGLISGPKAVAAYAITSMLMRVVRMPIDVVAHTPTVELSLASGAGEMARARQLLSGGMRTCLWIALCLIPITVVAGPTVVDLWTRHRVQVPVPLLLFASISTAIFSLALPAQEALMSLGQLGRATFWLVALSPPLLFLEWMMTQAFGLAGMGAAVVVLDLSYAALALYWAVKLFGFEPRSFVASLCRPPLELLRSEALNLRRQFRQRLAS